MLVPKTCPICGDAVRETHVAAQYQELQHALVVRDRRAAGTISAHGVDVARGHLFNQLLHVPRPGNDPGDAAVRAPSHGGVAGALQLPRHPALDATNWRAEQALRPAIITRKVCGGGNRSRRGADAQQVLATILRTAHQRGLDSADVLTTLLRAPAPIISPHFYATSGSVN